DGGATYASTPFYTEVGSQRASVQRNGQVSGAISLSFPNNVAAGNLLICCVAEFSTANSAVTDSQGNTWTRAVTSVDTTIASHRSSIWYATAGSSGACQVTLTSAVTSTLTFAIDEFHAARTTPLDTTAHHDAANGTVSPYTTNSLSTAGAGELLIACTSYGNT